MRIRRGGKYYHSLRIHHIPNWEIHLTDCGQKTKRVRYTTLWFDVTCKSCLKHKPQEATE